MEGEPKKSSGPSRILLAAGFLHRLFAYYLLAVIWITHTYLILELVRPVQPPVVLHVHLISWILPLSMAIGAMVLEYLTYRRTSDDVKWAPLAPKAQAKDFLPALIGLLTFGLWAGGYFLVGTLSAGRVHHSLAFWLDRRIPYVPQAVFVYLTVYPFALVPFMWERSVRRALKTAGAMLSVLLLSYVTMYLYPVALTHPAPGGPMLTRFALTKLHAADPAWNCFPSSHCAVVLVAALALWHQGRIRGSYGFLVAMAIGVSTLLTKQHYVADVLAGFAAALLSHWIFFGTKTAERVSAEIEDRASAWAQRVTQLSHAD